MDDTISRRAAIEAIDSVCEYCEYFKNEKLIQTIKDLPSAQPQIIRCKDCKDWHEYPDKKWGCCRREYWDDDGMFRLNLDTSSDDYCSYGEKKDV